METNKIQTVAIDKHYVREIAFRKYNILEEYDFDTFFKGYIEGVKCLVEPLGLNVRIDD